MFSDLTNFADILCRLIREEEPPRLQAVLRMAEAKLKSQNELTEAMLEPMWSVAAALCEQLSNQSADVRKNVVFGLVEVRLTVGPEMFTDHVMPQLNPSQQKLVDIYIKRKKIQQS